MSRRRLRACRRLSHPWPISPVRQRASPPPSPLHFRGRRRPWPPATLRRPRAQRWHRRPSRVRGVVRGVLRAWTMATATSWWGNALVTQDGPSLPLDAHLFGRMRRGIGRYREDCSQYVLSSAARGNTSELKRQVNGAAQPARLGMCCEAALTSFLIACRPRSCS